MITIMGYVNAIRNYTTHHSVNHGRSYIRFDENVFQSRIIPRLTILSDREYTGEYGYELKEYYQTVYLMSDSEYTELKEELKTECSECPYTENCNGQMCFFSMI